jgi:hypothetical protein
MPDALGHDELMLRAVCALERIADAMTDGGEAGGDGELYPLDKIAISITEIEGHLERMAQDIDKIELSIDSIDETQRGS